MTKTKVLGTVLTLEKFEEFCNYIQSDEFAEKEHEKDKMYAMGQVILNSALEQEVITVNEYTELCSSLNVNGGLIVSPRMYEKLLKVKLPKHYDKNST